MLEFLYSTQYTSSRVVVWRLLLHYYYNIPRNNENEEPWNLLPAHWNMLLPGNTQFKGHMYVDFTNRSRTGQAKKQKRNPPQWLDQAYVGHRHNYILYHPMMQAPRRKKQNSCSVAVVINVLTITHRRRGHPICIGIPQQDALQKAPLIPP